MHPTRLRLSSLRTRLPLAGVALALVSSTACLSSTPERPPVTTPLERSAAQERTSTTVRIGKSVTTDLTGMVTLAAEVRPKGQMSIVPRVTARLDRFYVDVGARVREGEPLAELDRADYENAVTEAQAAQAAAQAKLAQLKAGPRPEAVAQAEANLRAAQARYQALEAAQASNEQDVLQKRVAEARARLKRAEEAAAGFTPQSVAQAEAGLTTARNRLNELLNNPARANDKVALDAARAAVQEAEEAAFAARAGAAALSAVDFARREVLDAEQALTLSRLSINAFGLDQARALVEAAEAQVNLVNAPVSEEEIKAAEASVEQAFALVELARARLRDTTLLAPGSGVVTELHAAPGSTVGPTAPLVTLIPVELEVGLQVDENQLAHVQVGQAATLGVEAFPQESFAGVVKSISPVLDPRTRTVAVKVEVADPRGKLRPGMFAQVQVETGKKPGVVVVPKEAVVRVPGSELNSAPQYAVFLVADNRVKRARVQLGASDARNVEILQGLPAGMDVVLSPRPNLLDGESIAGN